MPKNSKSYKRAPVLQPVDSAKAAGLRYVSDGSPEIDRRRSGQAFRYFHPGGAVVRDRATLARIRSLAIPPAWDEVWICPGMTATSRPPGAMRGGASSTATTGAGTKCATKPSTAA
jgi:DNA topoisomerase IB